MKDILRHQVDMGQVMPPALAAILPVTFTRRTTGHAPGTMYSISMMHIRKRRNEREGTSGKG